MDIMGKNNPNWRGGISKDKRAYQKKWFQDNKEANRRKSREWYQNNKEKGRAICLRSRRKIRMMALRAYGGESPKCNCCGESEIKFLSIDHIENDGSEHRKKIGKNNLYYWLKLNGYPKGFQVLCYNCNFAKGHYGKCPHKN